MSKPSKAKVLRQLNDHKKFFEERCSEDEYCRYSRKTEENIKMIYR